MKKWMRILMGRLAGKAKDTAIEEGRRRMKKQMKKRVRRLKRGIFGSLLLLGGGFWLGVHRKLLLAWLRKEPGPQAPSWHFWCK